MVHCGSLMKSTLVAVVLLAVIHSGSAGMTKLHVQQVQNVYNCNFLTILICFGLPVAEKLASCCKTVTGQKIKEPITGYMVQSPNPPCVPAIM